MIEAERRAVIHTGYKLGPERRRGEDGGPGPYIGQRLQGGAKVAVLAV